MNQSALVYQAPTSSANISPPATGSATPGQARASARSSPSRRTRRRPRSRGASARARAVGVLEAQRPQAVVGDRQRDEEREPPADPVQRADPVGRLPAEAAVEPQREQQLHDASTTAAVPSHTFIAIVEEKNSVNTSCWLGSWTCPSIPSASATAAPRAATASSRGVAEGAVAAVICRESPTSAAPRSSRVEHHALGLVGGALDQLAHLLLGLAPRAEDVAGDDVGVRRVGPADADAHAQELRRRRARA